MRLLSSSISACSARATASARAAASAASAASLPLASASARAFAAFAAADSASAARDARVAAPPRRRPVSCNRAVARCSACCDAATDLSAAPADEWDLQAWKAKWTAASSLPLQDARQVRKRSAPASSRPGDPM